MCSEGLALLQANILRRKKKKKKQREGSEQIVLQPGVMALTSISFTLSVTMTVGD